MLSYLYLLLTIILYEYIFLALIIYLFRSAFYIYN